MALEHGGGHDKKEAHKGSGWLEKTLKSIGLGLGVLLAGPTILASLLALPPYLLAVGAGAFYLGKNS